MLLFSGARSEAVWLLLHNGMIDEAIELAEESKDIELRAHCYLNKARRLIHSEVSDLTTIICRDYKLFLVGHNHIHACLLFWFYNCYARRKVHLSVCRIRKPGN